MMEATAASVADFADDLILAGILIAVTASVHAVILDRIMAGVSVFMPNAQRPDGLKHIWRMAIGVATVLGIFLSHSIQIWLWAVTYLKLESPVLKTLEDAVYFSTVTYTTLGYGDVVLRDEWRVLSGIEAANGIILFGWSTAFLFEVMSILYPRKAHFGG